MRVLKNLLLLVVILVPGLSLAQQEVQPVLGVSTILTGEASTYGLDIRDALLFANEKIANNKYKLDFQDDKCDLKPAVDVAKYFTEIQRPLAVIGYGCSGVTIAAIPILQRSKLLTMVTVASSPNVNKVGNYIFRSSASDADSGKALAEWVIKKGHSKIGVISAETDYCQDIKNVFTEVFKEKGIGLVEIDYLPNTTDFKPYLLKLKKDGVDAIFLNVQHEGSAELALKDLAVLQWKPQLYSGYFPSGQVLLSRSASQMEGIEFFDLPYLADILTPGGTKLFDEFKSRYGTPRSYEAIFATTFEGFRALHLALQSGEDPLAYLRKTEFDGVFGKYTFDNVGQIRGLNFVMKKIRNGKVTKP